jgi:monovalent cation:H+ antiporter-2, CPA2 family
VRGALLLVELGTVIVGLATLARMAGALGFSPIPLYLLAGLAFGEGGLLPLVTSQSFIEAGAEIGLILLLFMLGLNYSAEELAATFRSAWGAGVVNVLNFLPGVLAGLALGWSPLEAAFLGGVTYVSSSGIIAKLLDDLGWIGNRETPVVLSILVLEDLTMAVFLPVVSVLAVRGTAATAILSVIVALAAVALVMLVALRFGRTISEFIFSESDEALLLSILGVTLLVAGLSEQLRASAAVGAFLVGIAVSGPAAERARALLGPLRDLFAAVFFLLFSLRIDPSTIPSVALVALALVTGSAAVQLATAWWSGAQAGVGHRGRLRAGVLLLARGEFSIAIAGLATANGLDPEIGAVSAAFVLLLAVTGPIATRLTDVALAKGRARQPSVVST